MIMHQTEVLPVSRVNVFHQPIMDLPDFAGWQLCHVCHREHIPGGAAAAFRQQLTHCATDWEQVGPNAATRQKPYLGS